ncbi:MAG: hypothetical protein ACLU92_12890 [Coprococcus comes]
MAAVKTQNGANECWTLLHFLTFIFNVTCRMVLTESEAQELIDHMTMKFRLVNLPVFRNTISYSLETLPGLLWK